MENTDKECSYCKQIKSIFSFSKTKSGHIFRQCKDCLDERNELKKQNKKRCRNCQEIKLKEDFPANRRICFDCHKIHADKLRKEYYKNNILKIRKNLIRKRLMNVEKCMWGAAKSRAKRDNLSFNIEISDIIIPDICPILGIKIFHNIGNGKMTDNSPVLDKIVPSLGYVKGNVKVISNRANRLKNYLTLELIEKIKSYIIDNYPKIPVDIRQ